MHEMEPIHAEYRDRDRRLVTLDDQQLAATFLFPTLACGVEEALKDDPIWATLAEAGVPVAFHLADSGYMRLAAAWGLHDRFEPFGRKADALEGILVDDRDVYETMASLITHQVFHRHPTLKVVSVENGSDWVAILAKRLRKKANQMPQAFSEDPLDVLRRNVWVTPYDEEDMEALVDTIGLGHVLFGSDSPHGEALAEPVQFVKELPGFTDEAIRRILRENALDLLGVPVTE